MGQVFKAVEDVIRDLGEVGVRLAEIEASEGAAGNISVLYGRDCAPPSGWSDVLELPSPLEVPGLAGCCILVTGSGRRLRECASLPERNLAHLTIQPGGQTMTMHASPERLFEKPTSELNTHLAIHNRHAVDDLHAVVHAQPLYITYLSHIARYHDQTYFNQHLLRWQPESIAQIPEGIGVLPFILPGSGELMEATVEKMKSHRLVLWGKHGLISRSSGSVKKAADLVEYAETGARYEHLNLANHGVADGLSGDEIRALCAHLGIEQTVF